MSVVLGIQNHLTCVICKDAEEAVAIGQVYHKGFTPLMITQAVIVQNGTVEGNSTVDLVMQDSDGKNYVVMLTGRLLKSIAC